MKVTRGALRQIINEELEAQILKENIISDLVDQIKDSGADAMSWIKDNAEVVRDKAEDAGIAVKDLVDDVVYKVDQVAGTEMSKQAKWDSEAEREDQAKHRSTRLQRNADAEWAEPENVRARALSAQEKEHAEWKKQKRKQDDIDWNKYQRAQDGKLTPLQQRQRRDDEEARKRYWKKKSADDLDRWDESINKKGNTNMKVTRGELKQIINEELEAQILRENIISDLVDLIKDSGDTAADWVKKNAKTVAKAAKSIGSDVGDVANELLHKVDKVAGTEMSKNTRFKKALGKQQDAWDTQNAEAEAATAAHNTPEAIAARQADREYEKEMEDWRAAGARVKAQDRDWEKERQLKDKELKKKISRGAPRGGHRMNMDTFGGAKFEGIDRDELKKAIKEELAKVLQGK